MTASQSTATGPKQASSPLQRLLQGIITFFGEMAQYPVAFTGMILVFGFILLAFIGPAIAPYDFDEVQRVPFEINGRVVERAAQHQPPSAEFWMGTDRRGRDIFSRILWGARPTIGLPVAATSVAVVLGTFIGLVSGYLGGWFDEILSRIMDSLLAIPALVLALIMLTTIVPILDVSTLPGLQQLVAVFGATNISLTIVIVLLYVPIVFRVVRSATLNVRDNGYVEEARLRGEKTPYILFREIFPSVLPALVVEASLRLSYAIFLVASLGFLGLGIQPPSPEWGRLILDQRAFYNEAPWSIWFPVLAIAILIVSVNLMADGLRRVFRNEGARE